MDVLCTDCMVALVQFDHQQTVFDDYHVDLHVHVDVSKCGIESKLWNAHF